MRNKDRRHRRLAVKSLVIAALLAGALGHRPVDAYLAEIGINPLRLEVGSRPLGMGAAFSGLADDVNAALYNPGGLAWTKGIALTSRNLENLVALQAYPLGSGASIGLAVINSSVNDVPIPGSAGLASSTSNIVLLAYGTKMSLIPLPLLRDNPLFQRVGFGLGLKGLFGETLRRSTLPDLSGFGWDLDLGVLYKGAEWWSVGLSAQNILPAKFLGGGRIKWDTEEEEGVPATEKIAAAARVIGDITAPVFMEGRELVLSGELDLAGGNPALLRLGGEWGMNKSFFLRTGIMQQWRPGGTVSSLNLGLGYRTEAWGVDLVSCREPLRDEGLVYFSFLYFPRDWVVIKQLEVERPAVLLETALEKISLEDNIVTYDDKIEVLGRVKAGVEVYVNDRRAYTAEDNTFKVYVPLQMEKNLIVVEARVEGEKKAWKYKVLRKAKVTVAEEKEVKKEIAKALTAEEKATLKKKEQEITSRKQKVEELVTMGVLEVTPEAEFKLDASITRGELATWLAKAAGVRLPKIEADIFPDVKKDHPQAAYIKFVTDWDLIRPYPDGTFRPETPVTKEEGEKLFRVLKIVQK